jgi:hypothetical protein
MLKKYIRPTIIVMIQVILPVVLLLLLAPQLVQFNYEFNLVQHFFISHQIGFLIAHCSFYLVLYWLWPRIISSYIKRTNNEITTEQIKSALNARWYLLAAMASFELLAWWR